MYHELKRIHEYEHTHTHILFGLHINLRCIFGILGMKLERKPMPGGQTQDLSQESSRHQTGFFPSTLLETAEISRYFEMCLLTLELSRLSSCQMLPCAASKSVTKKPTPSTVFDPASSCGPTWDSVQSGKGRVRNHQNWWDKIGKNNCTTR